MRGTDSAAGPSGGTPGRTQTLGDLARADGVRVLLPTSTTLTGGPCPELVPVTYCDPHVNGLAHPFGPRVVPRRALGAAAAGGVTLEVGTEVEDFLPVRDGDGAVHSPGGVHSPGRTAHRGRPGHRGPAQVTARACGRAHVLHLEPEDMAALTVEATAMTPIPLVGTSWVPGAGA